MKFTLVYWDTTLKAAGSNSRNWEKHHIRRQLSRQLEALWKLNESLAAYDTTGDIRKFLSEKFKRNDISFIPLVVETTGLVCDLDILFLRPGPAGRIISDGGDIDNRIKVLLDALRVPKYGNEIYLKPGESSPNPIYCLLEEDKLVTGLRVTTDQLLAPETSENAEACISIQVEVRGIGPYTPYEFKR